MSHRRRPQKGQVCARKGCTTPLKPGQTKFCSRQCYKESGLRDRNMRPVTWTNDGVWSDI